MNIILAEQDEITNQHLLLVDHRAEHIVKVLRASVGDMVRVGVINGRKGIGVIEAMVKKHPRSVSLKIELTEPMAERPQIDLILALARPIMMRRILSQATALGVGRFFLIHANRVEKSFWETSLLEQKSYSEHLVQGLEQAVDTRLPSVTFHRRFKPFIEGFLPTIQKEYSHCLLAHPTGNLSLQEGLAGQPERVLVAIGPEGGWVDYEVEKFQKRGFASCSIGPRIIKVDTAVIALHARVMQILENQT